MKHLSLQEEKTRAYIYRVCLALLGLLVAYDVINGTEQQVWASVLEAVLALGSAGLATKNTKRKYDD